MALFEKEYTLDDAYISLDDAPGKSLFKNVDDIMSKSIITDDFHTLKSLPNKPKTRRKKKEKIVTELPEEVQKDLQLLKMRDALDTKRFYKRSALKGTLKNVQIGVVIDSPADFYNSRLTKKQRQNTLVDELLADAKFKKDIKKRYVKIIEERKDKYKKQYKMLNKRKKKFNKDK